MPMLGNPTKSLRASTVNRGDLVGFVVDNVDPDKDNPKQRVRIRIPQLHRGVPDDKLPWSIPDASRSADNAGSGVGSVSVPTIGSKLYVRLEENDPHNPRYSGSPTTDDVNGGNELLKEDYPHTEGFTDAAGNRFAINKEKQTVNFTHTSGTTFFIDAKGGVSVSAASVMVGVEGDVVLAAKGKVNITGEGGVSINGQTVHLNKGDGASAGARTARTRPNVPSPAGNTNY